jgi:hypothetical protein
MRFKYWGHSCGEAPQVDMESLKEYVQQREASLMDTLKEEGLKLFTYTQVHAMIEDAFVQGFSCSGEGYNAECPYDADGIEITMSEIGGEFLAHNMMRKVLKKGVTTWAEVPRK